MNFTLEISASPALLQVLQSLAAALANPLAEPAAPSVPVSIVSDPVALPVQHAEPPAHTLVQLREILIEKSRTGSFDAVRQLLSSFNVGKLTDLPVSDYNAFYTKLSAL